MAQLVAVVLPLWIALFLVYVSDAFLCHTRIPLYLFLISAHVHAKPMSLLHVWHCARPVWQHRLIPSIQPPYIQHPWCFCLPSLPISPHFDPGLALVEVPLCLHIVIEWWGWLLPDV